MGFVPGTPAAQAGFPALFGWLLYHAGTTIYRSVRGVEFPVKSATCLVRHVLVSGLFLFPLAPGPSMSYRAHLGLSQQQQQARCSGVSGGFVTYRQAGPFAYRKPPPSQYAKRPRL